MTTSKDNSQDQIQRGLDELKAIGRELGDRLKDAGEDIKEAWRNLQPRIAEADDLASRKTDEMTREVTQATTDVIDDLKARLRKLRAKLDA